MEDFSLAHNMNSSLLSIVVPVYNSAATLPVLYAEIAAALHAYSFELILVDDGSKDASWEKIEALKREFPNHIRGIKLSRNCGQHNAIACGFMAAKGERIVTIDDDLQHPPSEIPKLIQRANDTDAEVVYGTYLNKQHAGWRNAGSWTVRKSSQLLEGNSGKGTSFRILTKDLAQKISSHLQTGYFFIDEVIHWYTTRIEFTPVEHHIRRAGKSTYTRSKLMTLYFDLMIHYSAFPLKMMTWIGLLSSFVTFILSLRFLYNKLVHGSSVPGFTAIIVAVLFSTSLLMFCMGIIGQYLYKLYKMQHRRPSYVIDRVL
jgi:polyisoprenyl-phosphate glycosyltransferase